MNLYRSVIGKSNNYCRVFLGYLYSYKGEEECNIADVTK